MGTSPTILRWAGSKRQLIPTLTDYWQASGATRYVEPFAGSACAFFSIDPESAILGDMNAELIETYEALKQDWEKVYKALISLPQTKEFYYSLRALESSRRSRTFKAARFIYLNRFCFNGLYRTNTSGKFNVPYGNGGVIPARDIFESVGKQLQKTILLNDDFEATLTHVREGDFVYMDPPFSVENTRVFIDYGPSKFSIIDIERLRVQMASLDKKGIKFLVSYLNSNEATLLAEGYFSSKVSVRRSIAGFASDRKESKEVLISNFKI